MYYKTCTIKHEFKWQVYSNIYDCSISILDDMVLWDIYLNRYDSQARKTNTASSGSVTRSRFQWWQTPMGGVRRRRRVWAAALLLLVAVAAGSISAWNYWGLSLPAPPPKSDITQYDGQTDGSRASVGVSRPSGNAVWVFDAGEPLTASATSMDGAVYFVSGQTPRTGRIVALDVVSGEPIWERQLNDIVDSSPTPAGDFVFVGTRSGKILALSRYTGETVWAFDMGAAALGPPVVRDGVLYAASDAVYALDALSGEPRWRHNVSGGVARPLNLAAGVVSVMDSDGSVNLINAASGRRQLTFRLWFGTSDAPSAANGALVIAGDGANVQALALRARDIPMEKAVRYWQTKLWLWGMGPNPALPRGYLWQQRELTGRIARAVGADDDSAYIATEQNNGSGHLAALDLDTGHIRWQMEFPSAAIPFPILTADALIVGFESGEVHAIDRLNGESLWKYAIPFGLSASPTLTKDGSRLLLLPTLDGALRGIIVE